MNRRSKCRGLFVAALIAVLVAAEGIQADRTCLASAENAIITDNSGSAYHTAIKTGSDHYAYVIGYPDGTVKPLATITREETATMFYRLMTEERRKTYASDDQPFEDVKDTRWSCAAIAALYQAKVILGDPDGSFRPGKPITRAEFAAIAARFNEFADEKENWFPDTEGHWAEGYVGSSLKKGWIRGYGDGTFRPDGMIIRCEAMMLINDALDRRVNTAGLPADVRQWPDNSADKWYYEIVLEAANTHEYERVDRPKSTERWIKICENPTW